MRRFRIERDADGLPARMVWMGDGGYGTVPLVPKTPAGLPRCLHVEDKTQCAGVGAYRDKRGRVWCGQHRRKR